MYADDIALYITVKNNINLLWEDIKHIVDWCDGIELTMNKEKTKYHISPKNKHVEMDTLSEECNINVGHTFLKEVKLYRYQGVEIDNLLTMKQHANILIRLVSHERYMLRHVRNTITMQAVVMIFKSVFLGVLDYGSIFVSLVPDEMKRPNNYYKIMIYDVILIYKTLDIE